MNLIEAIKSGKPYRRKYWSNGNGQWRPAVDFMTHWNHNHVGETLGDFVADDWETLDPSVTITRAQFWEAAPQFIAADHRSLWRADTLNGMLAEMARKLGLGEP